MLKSRVRWMIALTILAFLAIAGLMLRDRQTRNQTSPSPVRPEKPHEKAVYYRIVDIQNGKTLMILDTGPISVGDELITEDNRRFVVVKVQGTRGYAKFIEKVKLEK